MAVRRKTGNGSAKPEMKKKRFVPEVNEGGILKKMYHLLGDFRTDEERRQDWKVRFGHTPEALEEEIRALEEGPDGYWGENDYGPVYITREEMIERVKRCTEL